MVIVGEPSAACAPAVVRSDMRANVVKIRAINGIYDPRRYPIGYFMVTLEETG
jgi:hypothetical protein